MIIINAINANYFAINANYFDSFGGSGMRFCLHECREQVLSAKPMLLFCWVPRHILHEVYTLLPRRWLNLKAQPGVFGVDLRNFPGAGTQLDSAKVPVNGHLMEVPAVETHTNAPLKLPRSSCSDAPYDNIIQFTPQLSRYAWPV